ncbi:P-loop containing nucleoside triphosphate hydrolase protein [Heliocybe sulcata]|uniref:P-loop containing nucleoside triphosphate hydrolase protein n=1 Tax=Heliocybe sulcata TaxID=5364 RepID=A0A5C3NTI9_9AGAM|nr:P-loop containing nucleoside triphosphate hydrolase protein [Heliocybe sulcata]
MIVCLRNCRASATSLFSNPSHSKVVLRPYQEACLDACTEALKSGHSRIGVSLPTGSGKTTVFISLLSRIPSRNSEATRSLVLVSSIELAKQVAEQARIMCPLSTVEVEQGQKQSSGRADVTVATYQTLSRAGRLEKFDRAKLKVIVVDEAHHSASPSYRRILSRFAPEIKSPDEIRSPEGPSNDSEIIEPAHRVPIVGFTATFNRHDGLALGSVFERIVYHRSFLEMISEQWLCNVRFTCVRANFDLSQVKIARSGDFVEASLSQVIDTDTVNNLVLQTWYDKASGRKSTLIFCLNLAHIAHLTATFRNAGVDARYMYAGTSAKERKILLDDFKAGRFPVLINCGVLTEGADIPNIDCVILARPTRSPTMFSQMIGRGMRQSPETGKTDCLVVDFVGNTSRVAGVVCVPVLFGLDPSEVVDGATIDELKELAADPKSRETAPYDAVPTPKTVTYTDYEDPFSLVDGASGAPHITMSRNAWVGCGGDIYVLECLGQGYIRIEKVRGESGEAEWKAHYCSFLLDPWSASAMKIPPYARSRHVVTATTLYDAIRGSDAYAEKKVLPGPHATGLWRSAPWRRELATSHQKAFIRRRWRPPKVISLEETDGAKIEKQELRLRNLKKGEAANIITRLKHGAQKRYQTSLEKAVRQNVKEKKRQEKQKNDMSNFLLGEIDVDFRRPAAQS